MGIHASLHDILRSTFAASFNSEYWTDVCYRSVTRDIIINICLYVLIRINLSRSSPLVYSAGGRVNRMRSVLEKVLSCHYYIRYNPSAMAYRIALLVDHCERLTDYMTYQYYLKNLHQSVASIVKTKMAEERKAQLVDINDMILAPDMVIERAIEAETCVALLYHQMADNVIEEYLSDEEFIWSLVVHRAMNKDIDRFLSNVCREQLYVSLNRPPTDTEVSETVAKYKVDRANFIDEYAMCWMRAKDKEFTQALSKMEA
ncbi:hypothetical protein QR680_003116 [Steinernema hermaphroditum]|uniref:Uncharacterized protein n=1 Tax=Steinernema hermaphroditum TaxID=289476 RepID=A0AA39LJN6_9BILA|nr:hypothetical protein QR680_003116 [Steinernema hermaphroditum]